MGKVERRNLGRRRRENGGEREGENADLNGRDESGRSAMAASRKFRYSVTRIRR